MSQKHIMLIGDANGKQVAIDVLQQYGFKKHSLEKYIKEFAVSAGFTPEQIYGSHDQMLEINEIWNICGQEVLNMFDTNSYTVLAKSPSDVPSTLVLISLLKKNIM